MKKSFQQVSSKIYDTYGENSILPILFGVSSVFKNEIVSLYGQFPHLFLTGEFGTGKTSLVHFTKKMLGQSPDTVYNFKKSNDLYEKLNRNEVAFFDEYNSTANAKSENLIRAIYDNKSIYIGTSSIEKPQKNKLNASLAVAANPNFYNSALLHRCVLLNLDKQFFLKEEDIKFNELQLFFKNNDCNSYDELHKYGEIVKNDFKSNMSQASIDDYFNIAQRITENYRVLVSVYKSLQPHLDFPFSASDVRAAIIKNHCKHILLVI